MKEFKEFYDKKDDEDIDWDLFEQEVLDDANLTNKMSEFILNLDETEIPEDMEGDYVEIVELMAGDELDEALPAKRVRRDPVARRKAARKHRKERVSKSIEGKRTRKKAAFKRFKKKQKRKGKLGLTSTGKRKRTFINKNAGKIR